MLPELVIFDMAGTTVYDGDAVNLCLQEALRADGAECTRDEINRVMGIAKPIAISELLVEKHGAASADRVEKIYQDFLVRMLTFYRSSGDVREIEGASETFLTLQENGIKVALDTGFARPIVDAICERLGWTPGEVVDATVASDEVERGRPYPDLVLRAMQLTGVTDVSRVAKVGDTPSDLGEGTSAGCGWVIGVTGGSHTHDELVGHPHTHLITSVAELPALFGI